MPVQTFYNVFHENPMHWMIVVYFFLSGISSGVFLVSSACQFWTGEKYDKIKKIGTFLAPILLAGGLLFLLLDLGKPFRFWRMFFHFNPASAASWGAWLMIVFFLVALANAYYSWIQDKEKTKKFTMIGTPLALAVSLYSGFILIQMKAYALWHSALIPVLFSASAIISGIALIILCALLTRTEKNGFLKEIFNKLNLSGVEEEIIQKLGKFLVWFIAFDLLLVIVEILTLFNGHHEAVEVAKLLLIGAYAPVFLGLYIIAGLIVPLFILTRKELTLKKESIAAALVLIGILAMRYVIVMGGEYFTLS